MSDENYIGQQNKIREDYQIRKKISPALVILRSKPSKGIIFLFVFAVIVPVLIYYFIFDRGTFPADADSTCSVDTKYRIQCGGRENVTLNYCSSINCCYDNSTKLCFHYLPSKYYYFRSENLEETAHERSLNETPFQREMRMNVQLSVKEIDENNVEIILHGVNVTVSGQETVPLKNYDYIINHNPLYVEVYRNDSYDLLLTTAKGPTIISDNYWEWSFQMTDEYLFGLGETVIDVDVNSTFTKVIYGNAQDHNTLPVFMAYRGGKYHGLIVRHGGPLEVTVLPSKLVSLKSLAGEKIVLELSIGPTIQDVRAQQNRNKTFNVVLETLGVHLCREGTSLSLTNLVSDYQNEKDVYNSDAGIKFRYESDCLHENLVMALRNGNNASAVIEQVGKLIADGYEFTLTIPPQVEVGSKLYDNTTNLNVYYKDKNKTNDYQGKFVGTNVAYPYFGHTAIGTFIEDLIAELKSYFGDVWPQVFILGYNWPTDDSYKMEASDDFQYLSDGLIDAMSSTLPWNVSSDDHLQFLDHNEYGAQQLAKIREGLGEESTFMMTASHNSDITDPLIIQNVDISWTNFRRAIITTLYNSLFGFPLTSIPVCGSTSNFNASFEELCIRWYLMASTAPVFRISSDSPRRDPNSLVSTTSKYAADKAKEAIDFRYNLQYYFYTVLNNNEPLMRPMFYDFPEDEETFPLVHQYMVGGDLLVAQPTLPDQSQITVYLPKAVDTWYEFWGGQQFKNTGWVTLPVVESDQVLFIPAGSIIPLVERDENINKVQLIVTLHCSSGCSGSGSMKTSQDFFIFNSTEETLTVQRLQGDMPGNSNSTSFVLTEIRTHEASSNYYKLEQNLSDISDTWSYHYTIGL